jgi:HEAT repeat protein
LLDADEPDYAALARLGPQLLPHLKALIATKDEHYATKAASLASRIQDDRAVEVLSDAAKSPSSLIRLAVAGALRNLQRPAAAGVLMRLLNDADVGVRKLAIKSSVIRGNPALLAKVGSLSKTDPMPTIRTLAARAITRARNASAELGGEDLESDQGR